MNLNTHQEETQEPPLPQELVNLAELAAEESCPTLGQDQSSEASASPLSSPASPVTELTTRVVHRDERSFFGATEPQYVLQQENASHRLIIFLKAQGHSNVEVAQQTGVTPAMVAYTIKQPWAQKAIAEEIARAGRDAVELILKGAALKAAQKLDSLIDDDKATKETQRKACVNVLEQVYGQKFEFNKTTDFKNVDEDALDAFINQKKN